MEKPRFHIKHIALPIDPKVVKMWIVRGHVVVSHKPGKGKSQLFTWPEAVKIAFMYKLALTGLGPATTSQIADVIAKRASISAPEDWANADYCGHDRMSIFVYNLHENALGANTFISYGEFSFDELTERGINGSMYSTLDADYLLMSLADNLLANSR